MKTNRKTFNLIKNFELPYLKGSSRQVSDQSILKIAALEIFSLKNELDQLQKSLLEFENKYKMKSDFFYKSFKNGELGDGIDFFEWGSFYQMWMSTKKRLDQFEAL